MCQKTNKNQLFFKLSIIAKSTYIRFCIFKTHPKVSNSNKCRGNLKLNKYVHQNKIFHEINFVFSTEGRTFLSWTVFLKRIDFFQHRNEYFIF